MTKLRLLVIEIGIRNTKSLRASINTNLVEAVYADNILDVFDQIQTYPPHLIIISDFRGHQPTVGYIRTFRSALPSINIIILTHDKSPVNPDDLLYYIARGAGCVVSENDSENLNNYIFKVVHQLERPKLSPDSWRHTTSLAITWLRDHFEQSVGIIESLEQLTGYRASTLYHYIKEDTGKSPGCWIRELRIKGAIRLLEKSDFPIKMIAQRTGYNSMQGFLKAFYTITKKRPRDFRKGNSQSQKT